MRPFYMLIPGLSLRSNHWAEISERLRRNWAEISELLRRKWAEISERLRRNWAEISERLGRKWVQFRERVFQTEPALGGKVLVQVITDSLRGRSLQKLSVPSESHQRQLVDSSDLF